MKKINYVLLLILTLTFFTSCLKEGTPITGPKGKTGIIGSPGGYPEGTLNVYYPLNASTVNNNAQANYYYFSHYYSGYNPNLTYMLYVSASKLGSKNIYTLPWYNVYFPGDELYASIGNDSIKITYYNKTSGWPADSAPINAQIIVAPIQ